MTFTPLDELELVCSRTFKDEITQMSDREFVSSWPGMILDAMTMGDESIRGLARMMIAVQQRYGLISIAPRNKMEKKCKGRCAFDMADGDTDDPNPLGAPRP